MTTDKAPAKDPRYITGWAAAEITLPARTLTAMARNPHYAAPVSGDAKPRPSFMIPDSREARDLLNNTRAGTK